MYPMCPMHGILRVQTGCTIQTGSYAAMQTTVVVDTIGNAIHCKTQNVEIAKDMGWVYCRLEPYYYWKHHYCKKYKNVVIARTKVGSTVDWKRSIGGLANTIHCM